MQISASIINNIKTECVVESIQPLSIRFKFSDVPNDISLSQLMSNRCVECRVTKEVLNTCVNTEGMGNMFFTVIHILDNINFQIEYLNINSKNLQEKYDTLIKSIQDKLDDIKEDERRYNIIAEKLKFYDVPIAGIIINTSIPKSR